ncbi:MAG: ABC transporter permease subunit [Tuberibacillus sp.]
MLSFTVKTCIKFLLTAIGIIFVGSFPSLFTGMSLNFTQYFNQVSDVFAQLMHPSQLVYVEKGVARSLFPQIFSPYFYSMKIFFASFALALIAAFIFTYITFFLPAKFKRAVQFLAFIGESLPDVFIIIVFQLVVVWIYIKTHVLIMNTAGVWGDHVYLLPILCLAILPTFLFYRMILLSVEEQLDLDYVELAKSKGVRKQALLLRHISRNVFVSIFFYSKTVIWIMLSNLLILEYMFNITGVTLFMYDHPMPVIFTVCMLLVFIPVFLFFTIVQLLIQWITDQKVVA